MWRRHLSLPAAPESGRLRHLGVGVPSTVVALVVVAALGASAACTPPPAPPATSAASSPAAPSPAARPPGGPTPTGASPAGTRDGAAAAAIERALAAPAVAMDVEVTIGTDGRRATTPVEVVIDRSRDSLAVTVEIDPLLEAVPELAVGVPVGWRPEVVDARIIGDRGWLRATRTGPWAPMTDVEALRAQVLALADPEALLELVAGHLAAGRDVIELDGVVLDVRVDVDAASVPATSGRVVLALDPAATAAAIGSFVVGDDPDEAVWRVEIAWRVLDGSAPAVVAPESVAD